jgi:outer membrane receptor protein involved in Fe transport
VHVGPATARELGYVLIERQNLRDALGELGLGAQTRDYLTLSGGASSTWRAALGPHRAVAGVELRGDRFRDADAAGVTRTLLGNRVGGSFLAQLDLVLDRDEAIVVTPAIRYDLERTQATALVAGPTAFVDPPLRHDSVPSPRITARAAATPDLSLKASTGVYMRLPTLLELFGDRGSILGTPELRPEHGTSSDAGLVWAPARALGDVDRIMVEAAAFATRSHDAIAFVPTAGFATRAANVADAMSYGAELVASLRIARTVSVTANYTRLVTAQLVMDPALANKELPRQPGHTVYARVDAVRRVRGHQAALWIDGSWQSDAYIDIANLQRVPARLLLGTGARVELVHDLALVGTIENLTDLRVVQLPLVPPPRPDLTTAPTAFADVANYPLPGRSLYLSLEWSLR